MNLLLLDTNAIPGKIQTISGIHALHIIRVLGVQAGDTIRAGIINDSWGTAKIVSIDRANSLVSLTYIPEKTLSPEKTETVLYSALQRPQTVKKILHLAGCAGIRKVIFMITDKAQKSYLTSSVWKDKNLQNALKDGMEQCKKIMLPEVAISKFIPAVNDDSLKLLLDETGRHLSEMATDIRSASRISVALGPESGFTGTDIEKLEASGFIRVKLTDYPLRSENSLSWFLGQLDFIRN